MRRRRRSNKIRGARIKEEDEWQRRWGEKSE